jgi:hypothetical protein
MKSKITTNYYRHWKLQNQLNKKLWQLFRHVEIASADISGYLYWDCITTHVTTGLP